MEEETERKPKETNRREGRVPYPCPHPRSTAETTKHSPSDPERFERSTRPRAQQPERPSPLVTTRAVRGKGEIRARPTAVLCPSSGGRAATARCWGERERGCCWWRRWVCGYVGMWGEWVGRQGYGMMIRRRTLMRSKASKPTPTQPPPPSLSHLETKSRPA